MRKAIFNITNSKTSKMLNKLIPNRRPKTPPIFDN